MRLIFGEEVRLEPITHVNDADNAWGPAWHAWRTEQGFVLEYDTGDLAGRLRRFDISASEFGRLHTDPEQFEPIIHAHGG